MSTPQSTVKLSLQAPSTPRIDISRASSSSHHEDSRDSSPERELFEGPDPANTKLGLGFREEGTLDLRSSTEELDFQDPQLKNKPRTRPQSPCFQDDYSIHGNYRKDSQSSDIVLLSISGRTSRLSSIGSQGSAHSRLSNASHLSIVSGQSGVSRSPSPHKMLLETSFCGAKPPKSAQSNLEQQGAKMEPEDLEKVLLSRKHDPTEAILAEGISVPAKNVKQLPEKPPRKIEKSVQNVKSDITITVDKPISDSNNTPKIPRTYVSASGVEYTYIPLKGPLPPPSASTTLNRPKTRETKSASVHSRPSSNIKEKHSVSGKPKAKSATPSPVTHHRKEEEPKYIRIKLKPDHCYDDDDQNPSSCEIQKPYSLNLNNANKKPPQTFAEIIQKETVRVEQHTSLANSKNVEPIAQGKSLSSTPSASPKPSRHNFLKEVGSKTPSPSLSRKSSFCSLFKSRETIISPESPTVANSRRKSTLTCILREASDSIRERSRSRSKSRDRDKSSTISTAPSSTESIDSNKTKQKSVFSIFKPKKSEKIKTEADSSSSEVLPALEVEFKFNSESNRSQIGHRSRPTRKHNETPLEGDSIRIPLHSPTHSENLSLLQELKTSSQDSQETVIEVTSRNVNAVIESTPSVTESNNTVSKIEKNNRQSSTSSENVVFSTKLGSNNEIFTTKLPKANKKTASEDVLDNSKKNEERTVEHVEFCASFEPDEAKKEIPEVITKNNVTKTNKPANKARKKEQSTENRASTVGSVQDEDHNSSESERDSELEFFKSKKDLTLKLDESVLDVVEPERKGLVLQQDSFEDELPYVPTTLPLERSIAVPIVPVKQRSTFEMKTCPIERPRSTTPINPSCLEEYCSEVVASVNVESITKTIEKLKISLPKDDVSERHGKIKSPRKTTENANWSGFAEKGISNQRRQSREETTPPPLPPKGIQKEWINFEEIPERRKAPKRIQTIPSRGTIEVPEAVLQENVVYSYVNPEDCKCECHEISARSRERQKEESQPMQEDEMPLLEDEGVDDEKSAATDPIERIKLDVTVSDRASIVR